MSADVSNSADIIDSRDIVERIEEIEGELVCPECGEPLEERPELARDGLMCEDPACGHIERLTDVMEGMLSELAELRALVEEIEGYSGDTARDGITMIRDSYFKEYAQEFAEDIGAIESERRWPAYCIDWDWAARELQQDYTSVEYDGVTYWVR
jgi:hypothetical protein